MWDTPQGRRRSGVLWLAAAFGTLALFGVLAAPTGTFRWLLYATPLVVLGRAMGLILLMTPPAPPPHGGIPEHLPAES